MNRPIRPVKFFNFFTTSQSTLKILTFSTRKLIGRMDFENVLSISPIFQNVVHFGLKPCQYELEWSEKKNLDFHQTQRVGVGGGLY